MLKKLPQRILRLPLAAVITAAVALLAGPPPVQARVTRLVIDTVTSPAFSGAAFGAAGQYETIAGRVFGELDPFDAHNAIINDIELAPRNGNGKVEYMATFFIVKPIEMSKSSGFMWQDVPNRGGRVTISSDLRAFGDVGLSSGWQGDNSGETARQPAPGNTNDYAVVPIPRNPNGSPITGQVMGRILNPSGLDSSRIIEHSNPIPYRPVSLDTGLATLEYHDHETTEGVVTGVHVVPSGDWRWARCDADHPFPGTPDSTQICVGGGFVPNKVYQVVFTAQDPYILAVGSAAFRDATSFFRYETRDDFGTRNPLAGQIRWVATRGSSQSGTFVRQLIHFGFTQDEANRKVYDGAWPIIAARRIALNFRFAKPDLVMKLYEAGSEGPLWWHQFPDHVRGLPPRGILDRCERSNTCPKVFEHFGAAEVWGQKLTTGWVGTNAKADIPLPKNVRRYYFASSPHGGGAGGVNVNPGTAPPRQRDGAGPGDLPAHPLAPAAARGAVRGPLPPWLTDGVGP